jgi:4-amino-4-deoxy-L-arabinose transferase-like glycosyltransferase
MALWAFLGFLLYCDRWLNPKQVHGETTGTRHTAPFLALLLGATASLIILPFLYSIFLMLAFLGFERYGRQAWKKSSLLLFLAGIVGLTAAWYAYANTASTVVIPLSRQTYAEFMRFIFTWRLWKVHLISRFPELCATYSGLLLGGIGACQLWRREGRRSIFWFYWFGATIVHISLLGRYGLVHEYTDLPFAPVTAVFIGAGIVYAWDMARNRKIWQTAVILLVIGVPVHAALRIKHWYRLDRLWVFRARGVVARLSQPDDLVITNSPGIGPTINYHIDRYGWGVNLEDNGVSQIQMYRTQGARFFLTAVDPSWLQHPEWTTYFSQHAKLLYQDPEFLIYEFTDRGKVSAPS